MLKLFHEEIKNKNIKNIKYLSLLSGDKGAIFNMLCYKGHLEIAKVIWKFFRKECELNMGDTFLRTCENGYLETAKWLWGISHEEIGRETKIDLLMDISRLLNG